ncbi:hypothetical protein CHS0354_023739 [Potamilus streckersoni]|uniref:Queuine tRNA-ribosyltransferase catalytic subunit 1 n=1 Tax=Potamilus streckersoni TaxID=2493646 RepID=A0AAE0RZ57_9BIVA|nr:hypothetical protein CHS0354_023739 [Potamilus streckersoni]
MFELIKQVGEARVGRVVTNRGEILTPVFMPVGTRATVRGVHQHELMRMNSQVILSNTYHLYLKPGMVVLKNAGGLHKFMGWEKPILTDSGGFQAFSLAGLREISEQGINFKSHIDGSKHMFTPENVIDFQRVIGSDIVMPLDECPAYSESKNYIEKSTERTIRWAERSRVRFENTSPLYEKEQFLFAITQGGVHKDLRESCSKLLIEMNFDGYAIGGLAVGESEEVLYETLDFASSCLPKEKPRYLMGVGTPSNILNAIERGVDMFDCVIPTREGRNGRVYTKGGTLSIRSARYANDFSRLDEEIESSASHFSKAYIRHLLTINEMLGLMLCSIHNVVFFLWLAGTAREKILDGSFKFWKEEFLATYDKN